MSGFDGLAIHSANSRRPLCRSGNTGAEPSVATDLAASGASTAYDGARACLARNDLPRAERLARNALNASPDDPSRVALLAWIETLAPANQGEDAIRARVVAIDRAMRADLERRGPDHAGGSVH